eukprot:CAMPEP_0182593330 /NCGR_PEP_ID=MMETSP1324-20130603/77814_1 /TAXON_ID=236786 /ORGANISM="Florenciella sp., Strain RCC1587" /LENGTH=110 /DNA_ID=CAMNT_0024810781 /DNA_START=138 /DNA_END=473 /DNA_ORIENTATION=-
MCLRGGSACTPHRPLISATPPDEHRHRHRGEEADTHALREEDAMNVKVEVVCPVLANAEINPSITHDDPSAAAMIGATPANQKSADQKPLDSLFPLLLVASDFGAPPAPA